MPDITENGPVMSAKVEIATVIVFQLKDYRGEEAILPLGHYPNTDKFPQRMISSLKVDPDD